MVVHNLVEEPERGNLVVDLVEGIVLADIPDPEVGTDWDTDFEGTPSGDTDVDLADQVVEDRVVAFIEKY